MSHVSFNRKRAKLKQLLGIRARLALLALILVAPLMLERARSLEGKPEGMLYLKTLQPAASSRPISSSVTTRLRPVLLAR